MKKPIICKEVAEASLESFKDRWDFEDPKEVVSGGEESSITEYREVLISNIMMGRTAISEDGTSITHTLRSPLPGASKEETEVTSVLFEVSNYKQHNNKVVQGAKTESEAMNLFIQDRTGLSKFQYSELSGKDSAALTAIASHLFFI